MVLCKKVVWFSSLYRKGPGRKICRKVWPCSCKRLSYDICNVFVGHFWSQSYQLINLPLIHKQHSPKYGNVSSCYGHNSSPIPWPGLWNPTLNCIKSLTGLLVEGRCIGRPANRGGQANSTQTANQIGVTLSRKWTKRMIFKIFLMRKWTKCTICWSSTSLI